MRDFDLTVTNGEECTSMPDTVQHVGEIFPVRPEIAAKAHVS